MLPIAFVNRLWMRMTTGLYPAKRDLWGFGEMVLTGTDVEAPVEVSTVLVRWRRVACMTPVYRWQSEAGRVAG